ncbi:uncharacterized protein LOC128884236 isoform X1 [Hylaeus volcanicus]|uniref:uncharacterized protein LOC128884236 isoform X1 n=1 Tax=Hylaeus volcanicus TaxID=313075 RepID=UPI0023B8835E|nr:uncharacterized protein LOC128884236 isoform X1 [Hylaeus volcanicus]XP_053993451.1 uncharacterized protein LOC128884236 isoform X1 [Hylaeus volcanicus]XP_053993452.1 uncharacterized protein LOC128884236 isoform X1 [Hylaeus volcanicus]XP_053993453.1 uncharacterized protein LOC128884236 isoform X1 [Hylaeus volcanicus]
MFENNAHLQNNSKHVPHPTNEFLDSFQPNCRKHLSFSKNGGLSGCVQLATAERRQRQGSDFCIGALASACNSIKLENYRRRIRELVFENDLEESPPLAQEDSLHNTEHAIDPKVNKTALQSQNGGEKDISLYTKSSDTAFDNFFRNKKRDAQRSSLRFYSLKDNDTNVQQRLQSLLNSYVKQ